MADFQFESVVFDCDGVLIDSEPISNAVLADQIRTEIGYEISAEESHRKFTGMVVAQIEDALHAETGRRFRPGWVDRHFEKVFERYQTELEAMPGVHALVDYLDGLGIPWGVASQSAPDYLAFVLEIIGLHDRARGRVTSAREVANPKPHPDVYLLAFERVGGSPSRSLVIEDSPTGARAGVAAGATVIGYAHDRPAQELLDAGCETTIAELAEVQALVGSA